MTKKFNYVYETKITGRTVEHAIDIMLSLDAITDECRLPAPEGPGLLDVYAQRLIDGDANSGSAFAALTSLMNEAQADGFKMTEENSQDLFMAIVVAALHPAVEALLAETVEESYEFLLDAKLMVGLLYGILFSGDTALVLSEFSRKGGLAGKQEYRDMEQNIHKWYIENQPTLSKLSVDKVAQQVMKIEPVSIRTAQKWINKIRKSLT